MNDPSDTEMSSKSKRTPKATAKPRLSRAAKLSAIAVAAAAGLFAVGFASGWMASTNLVLTASPAKASTGTGGPAVDDETSIRMPDVRGLSPENAQQVLADAGLDIAKVTTTDRPAAGESGLVISQVPAFGAPNPSDVTITVSAPASVPEVVGQTSTAAIARLTDLGAQVQRDQVYVPGAVIGAVMAIDPAAGAALPTLVTIRVASVAATVRMSALDSDGRCSSTTATVDGREWTDALACESAQTGRAAVWALDGAADEVVGTVGIDDGEDQDAAVTVQMLADGVVIATYEVENGEPILFTLGVAGVQELTVLSSTDSDSGPDVVFEEFEARGSAEPIDELSAR